MGGKIWSVEEEQIFWKDLIPHSPKRLDEDFHNNKEKPWAWVAAEMSKRVTVPRRKYTGLGVYEHYFLNAYQARFSPNVGQLAVPYWRFEQSLKKKQKKKTIEKKRLENEEQGEQSQAPSAEEGNNTATGSFDSPIAIDCQFVKARLCQYPTHRPCLDSSLPQPYHGSSLPAPIGFAVSSAIPNPVPHGAMHSQYHSDNNEFAANHDHLESTEVEDEGLFVNQSAADCVNAMAPWSPSYPQQ
ncbi:uncharacterized protein B0T15DRAFT_551047 [Chaetomium strumarium]|uniref:Uncharacterized protein n=1 Tax=Chaetomium strumarium TaxID=1170767 RepID=A0AAJ0M4Q7_9PEZI|nr:hypothetical protein B0T15DRAFT_551047 [Chaetomium strumarium]